MNKRIVLMAMYVVPLMMFAQSKLVPAPVPPVIFRPAAIQAGELPVSVETAREIVADNGLCQRVETTITFTNPNGRVFEGELEFPLPDGATVCGYALEVNGVMVPGVVCEKEQARTAFENEKRRDVDPGIVEHVKGNVWKTRIYPLRPKTPRKARVAYVAPIVDGAETTVVECDGEDVFVGQRRKVIAASRADRLRVATKATIYWDASMSRHGKVQADRNLLECLPETGEWKLVVFRNVVESPVPFTSRAALLKAVDELVYDGGTCLEKIERAVAGKKEACFVFTDECDVEAAAKRAVAVRKLAKGEKPPQEPKEGRLLAVAWAADRVADLSGSAEAHKAELIALGRLYGVASPVTSLIVLESLDQYLRYKIEPPPGLSFHDEWVKRRAAADDPIARAREKAEHQQRLLALWEERVKWWNDPIPPKKTPKSGLFDRVSMAVGINHSRAAGARPLPMAEVANADAAPAEALAESAACEAAAPAPAAQGTRAKAKAAAADGGGAATVTIAAWNPETPYLKALDAAEKGSAYAEYLKQREVHGKAPAFYLDCAGWFFKAGERVLAIRVISNLGEMKLEDPSLWRTMGWRLREAGAYEEAIAVFRHVLELRGEEAQSRRDLALVLTERGKELYARGSPIQASPLLQEAMRLLHETAFEPAARRSARRSNDMQTSVLALEELNGLVTWSEAQHWSLPGRPQPVPRPQPPAMDEAFARRMPLRLRIVMSWDVDETDIDLHVLEPDGEEAYYGHRRTSSGGFVSEDVTTGYGPEEYLRKEADKGVYRILANYFASHQQALTGAATVTATVYTGWGTKDEKRQVLSFRLDKPKDKHPIGEIKVD